MNEKKITEKEKLELIMKVRAAAIHLIALNGGKDIVLVPENEDMRKRHYDCTRK